MKLDSTNSLSAANNAKCHHLLHEGVAIESGKHFSGLGKPSGPEVECCLNEKNTNDSHCESNRPFVHDKQKHQVKGEPVPWCYIFVHHRKVNSFENQLINDDREFFIHTSVKYVQKKGKANGCKKVAFPTVSGLVFIKGHPYDVQRYLDIHLPNYHLCRNCSTGRAAEIPNSQMQAFMCVAKTDPERIRFLLHPFVYYSKNRTLLRITTGDLAGMEGYVIRIASDRKLVMEVGGMCVAIGGIHYERFEEVGKNQASRKERKIFYKRNLHEREAFIDRYFHRVSTVEEAREQAESIELLLNQSQTDLSSDRISAKEALDVLYFIIEENGYYYGPFLLQLSSVLKPVIDAGCKVAQAMARIIDGEQLCEDARQRHQTDLDELRSKYGYLFE